MLGPQLDQELQIDPAYRSAVAVDEGARSSESGSWTRCAVEEAAAETSGDKAMAAISISHIGAVSRAHGCMCARKRTEWKLERKWSRKLGREWRDDGAAELMTNVVFQRSRWVAGRQLGTTAVEPKARVRWWVVVSCYTAAAPRSRTGSALRVRRCVIADRTCLGSRSGACLSVTQGVVATECIIETAYRPQRSQRRQRRACMEQTWRQGGVKEGVVDRDDRRSA